MASRYTLTAAALHWATAVLLLSNLALGWWMSEAIEREATRAVAVEWFQVHKSIGLTVLALTVVRILWRLAHKPPPLTSRMRASQRFVAGATHLLFYVLLLALPLSGWLYASTQWRGDAPLSVPTLYFGLFEVPHIGALATATEAVREAWARNALTAHQWLAGSTVALFALHLGAALKHQFVDRDGLITRMLPRVAPGETPAGHPLRRLPLRAASKWATATTAVVVILGVIALIGLPRQPAPPADVRGSSGAWRIDAAASEIAWTGRHAGRPFRGTFERWSADIDFDPARPQAGVISATIETDSATNGVALHERTLPQKEWFDVANHPTASYRSTAIEAQPDGSWRMPGTLTIKTHPVALSPLTVTLEGGVLRITGAPVMDRRDAEIGTVSDPGAKWVSADITIEVDITAVRSTAP